MYKFCPAFGMTMVFTDLQSKSMYSIKIWRNTGQILNATIFTAMDVRTLYVILIPVYYKFTVSCFMDDYEDMKLVVPNDEIRVAVQSWL